MLEYFITESGIADSILCVIYTCEDLKHLKISLKTHVQFLRGDSSEESMVL